LVGIPFETEEDLKPMVKALQRMIHTADAAISSAHLSLFPERDALLVFLFHSLFCNTTEIELNSIDPLQRTTIGQFREFVEYYLESGYQFIGPEELATGREADGKYALITFDDGYFNNTLALAVLEEFHVPAIFFISSDYVQQNRCFWWDVLYRQLASQGASRRAIYEDTRAQKMLRTAEIESRLQARFGPGAFTPRGDVDRPFAPSELRDFSRNALVHIGNHTAGHAILTNYSNQEIRQQIRGAQDVLESLTGKRPAAIAYPNGNYTPEIIQICREEGLKLGFTTRQRKNRLPLQAGGSESLSLDRYSLTGNDSLRSQCRQCRSDLQIYSRLREEYASIGAS
jgi:peptidoglycan/xylan/chitin deacetylase (PgdA/CDA1 family)